MEKAKRITIMIVFAFLAALIPALAACRKSGTETVRRDISGDSPYSASVLYANDAANTVQAVYTDGERHGLRVSNMISSFETDLTGTGNMGIGYFANSAGKNYFENSLDLYVIDSEGAEWTDRGSVSAGRVNTTRLGYYYYETKVQEYGFGLTDPEAASKKAPVKLADFTEKWEINMVEISQKAGEKITLKLEFPTDGYIHKKDLNVPADNATTIRITMKITGTAKTGFFLYYDSVTGKFNDKQKKTISLSNDGEYHTYYVDISDSIQGNLNGYRIQFQGEKGDVIEISDISAMALGSAPALKANKIYHVFPDKLHQELRIYATEDVDNVKEYGMVLRLPEQTVESFQIKDANGTHGGLDFDPASVEYAGFLIKDAGVVGLVIPDIEGNTARLSVKLEDGFYVIRQVYGGSTAIAKNAWITLSNRLYSDETAGFEGIAAAARAERSPVTKIEITDTDSDCRYVGYDKVRGLYLFNKNGSDFSTSYYLAPDARFSSSVKITNDTGDSRSLYMCFNTPAGCLECAVVSDREGRNLIPIPVEVCKNFCGEFEDRFYDPADTGYGDSIFPMVLSDGETTEFRETHLYQNWGKFPLKQLSSIQFHVSYYQLSTGVTESNCIAPYYVYGKDGWILPDFRGCSSKMWDHQPQYNALGVTKLVSHYSSDGAYRQAEYTGSDIRAYGPTYADIDYSYVADDGTYEYTVRHLEFPHTDENRTYYELDLRFLKNLTLDEVRRDFTLLMFNSYNAAFHWLTYTGGDGNVAHMDMKLGTIYSNEYAKMRKGSFWYAWNNITEPSHENPLNYGVVVRDYDVRAGGRKFSGNFLVRNACDGAFNSGYLTLDLGKTTFRKGDYVRMSFVLIPWGNPDWESHSNMEKLFEDSAVSPLRVDAATGAVSGDKWLPLVRCENEIAEFTVSGGRGNTPVRVDGFTSPEKPEIFIKNGGNWEPYELSVNGGADGYMVHLNGDGTYGFSFVFEQKSPESSTSFRVEGKNAGVETDVNE